MRLAITALVHSKTRGFTIVELLIVVVIIAILAAISVSAYNGVQTRAKNLQIITIATTYIKALRMYEIDKQRLPGSGAAGTQFTCFGTGYPGERCSNVGGRVVTSYYTNELSQYIGTVPIAPTDRVLTNNSSAYWMGIMYEWNSATEQNIRLVHLNSTTCPNISGVRLTATDVGNSGGSVCTYNLN